MVILRDGDPGQPEVTLSPLRYHYEHRAGIDVLIQKATGRDAAFDALCAAIGARIAADRTLGGLCDWCEAEAPEPVEITAEGGEPIKAATVAVILTYSTANPL
jgi:NAD/NADP transhydrogenase alpha subunit